MRITYLMFDCYWVMVFGGAASTLVLYYHEPDEWEQCGQITQIPTFRELVGSGNAHILAQS
jgi:hypothetical protein